MTYIFYITEDIIPSLTKEQRDQYRVLREAQILPIRVAGTRQLAICMTNEADILEIMTILTDAGKTPRIIGAMDMEWNELAPYARDFDEIATFMMDPIITPDIEGNELSRRPQEISDLPNFWGWPPFNYVKPPIIETIL